MVLHVSTAKNIYDYKRSTIHRQQFQQLPQKKKKIVKKIKRTFANKINIRDK